MRVAILSIVAGSVFAIAAVQDRADVRRVTWDDLMPLRGRLESQGLSAAGFPAFVEKTHAANARRVREGDLDHLVFYLLQSTRFTSVPAIEPALSAKALVESLDTLEREEFLKKGEVNPRRVSAAVEARASALLRALGPTASDPRLVYFRELVGTVFPSPGERRAGLLREYARAMRFLYEREFVAQRSNRAPEAVVELYRARGLSTDTAIEAGYLVYLGLGVMRSLNADRLVRRVLIVGPGLDLAPRTGLLETGPPESYQPWAVIDTLLALGLARAGEFEVVAADINPRVVQHIRRSQREPPVLTLVSGIGDSDTVTLTADYREYFARLGRAIGDDAKGSSAVGKGHLHKTVRVRPEAARALRAEALDVVTERLTGPPFDLVVATNILPYFDDVQLALAMSNISGMLAPGGVFLHNEVRPAMRDITSAVGLPAEQSRHAIIADVRGAPAPLFDSVWLHRKASN